MSTTVTATATDGQQQEYVPARFVTLTAPSTRHFETELAYVLPGTDNPAMKETFNYHEEMVPVTIRDTRGRENEYSLDTHGFQFVKHRTAMSKDDFTSEAKIKETYYSEVKNVIQRVTGASNVLVFHYICRHSSLANQENLVSTKPLHKVHVDASEERVKQLIRIFAPDKADALLQKRYGLVNLWRPLKKCFKEPLVFCDGSKVPDEDFAVNHESGASHTAPKRDNTAVIRRPESTHDWHYLHGQEIDEPVLIRCWDTKDGIVKRCPHTAARNSAMDAMEDRESIEIRCLVFWDE